MYTAEFARFYDRHWRDFGEAVAPRILQWTRDLGIAPGRVLDLCCGTGASSDAFTQAGWQVTGVDLSPDMIALARARHAKGASPIATSVGPPVYVVGDVTELPDEVPGDVDLTVCLYDSLNHLPDEQALRVAFAQAAGRTRRGGRFVFDLNTRLALEGWEATCQVIDDTDGTLIARGSYDLDTARASLHILGYHQLLDGSYGRFETWEHERWFPTPQVVTLLQDTGWTQIRTATYRDLHDTINDPDTQRRIVFTATRM